MALWAGFVSQDLARCSARTYVDQHSGTFSVLGVLWVSTGSLHRGPFRTELVCTESVESCKRPNLAAIPSTSLAIITNKDLILGN